jgi:L-arabinokinase
MKGLRRVVAYLTAHGYGHAVRCGCVLAEIQRRHPTATITIASGHDPALLARLLPIRFKHRYVTLDAGAIDDSSWRVDAPATVNAVRRQHTLRRRLLREELPRLLADRPDIVLADVPALACRLARRAGVPSVAIANFTWDDTYAEVARAAGEDLDEEVGQLRADYATATLALQTPLGYNLCSFKRREFIPLIARRPSRPREMIRAELGIGPDQLMQLVALRGVIPTSGAGGDFTGIRTFALETVPLPYAELLPTIWNSSFPDLVAAADVVLSKPGYGIVSECLAAGTPFLYLPRTGFLETAHLLADGRRDLALEELAPSEFGGPAHALKVRLLARSRPRFTPPTDGARVAADWVERVAAGG